MSPTDVFQTVNTLVLPAWLILIFAPKKKWRNPVIYSLATAMASVYTFYVISGIGNFDLSAFNSLAGVKELFTQDEALLAGWIHYLVFDLLIGNWIVDQSIKHRIKYYLVVPCLFLTFMFGPLGYLFYTILKVSKVKTIA